MTIDEIVGDYIRKYRRGALEEMRSFEQQRNASDAIGRAALCETTDGKRHPHQRRLPRALLESVEVRLQAIGRNLAKATDFATLHRLVDEEIGGIKGIGALTVYDITHRIGAYFGRIPEHVYLHAGARIGARAFAIKEESFDPRILPKAFSCLSPAEIEDCLCIYKNELTDTCSKKDGRKSGCDVARPRRGCHV